jgi:hypothetical protein
VTTGRERPGLDTGERGFFRQSIEDSLEIGIEPQGLEQSVAWQLRLIGRIDFDRLPQCLEAFALAPGRHIQYASVTHVLSLSGDKSRAASAMRNASSGWLVRNAAMAWLSI